MVQRGRQKVCFWEHLTQQEGPRQEQAAGGGHKTAEGAGAADNLLVQVRIELYSYKFIVYTH